MRDQTLVKTIARSFKLLLLCATFCLICLAMAQVASLRVIGDRSKTHVLAFEPAKQFAGSFERENLNARILFNTFFANQKPADLAAGWGRFHNAEAQLSLMAALVGQQRELQYLRAPAAQLNNDMSAYGASLNSAVKLIQTGEVKGPRLEALLTESNALGATVDKATDNFAALTFRSSEVDSNAIAESITDDQAFSVLLLAMGFFIYYLLTRILRRKLATNLREQEPSGISIMEPVRVAPTASFGTR